MTALQDIMAPNVQSSSFRAVTLILARNLSKGTIQLVMGHLRDHRDNRVFNHIERNRESTEILIIEFEFLHRKLQVAYEVTKSRTVLDVTTTVNNGETTILTNNTKSENI
jgi:hypothetical protein